MNTLAVLTFAAVAAAASFKIGVKLDGTVTANCDAALPVPAAAVPDAKEETGTADVPAENADAAVCVPAAPVPDAKEETGTAAVPDEKAVGTVAANCVDTFAADAAACC